MILFKKRNAMESVSYLSFCIPALFFYLTFYVYPTLSGFYYSLTDWTSMKNEINFIGLKNFIEAFGDKDLLNSIVVTLTYTVTMTAFQNLLGLFLALAVDMKLKASKLYKIIIFLPYVLPTVVSSNIWVYIYNPINGLISIISKSLGLGEANVLGNPNTALIGVIITNLWQLIGFSMVIYYASLQSVPQEMLEASKTDGVGPWGQFLHIKLPLIMPAVTINVIYSLIAGLKVFDYIYVMTNGGPGNATQSISAMVYFAAFSEGFMGYASAIGIILFTFIAVLSYASLKFLRKREVEA